MADPHGTPPELRSVPGRGPDPEPRSAQGRSVESEPRSFQGRGLLEVRRLSKHYAQGSLLRRRPAVRAVDDVSFTVDEGETFGLVGESGSGKTTTARCILRLTPATAGEVWFRGENVLTAPRTRLRAIRRELQAIFQDPSTSLNPRMRAVSIVGEPLEIHRIGTPAARRARVEELFALVGLDPARLEARPHEFSGGERQRIGIARALALSPSFLVADEPVSALDVSVQAQVMNLLMDLRAQLGLTYLLITHDLRLVRHVCTRVAVMYCGRIVEVAPTGAFFAAPQHPYTRALLSATPTLEPGAATARVVLDAGAFDPAAPLREVAQGHWAAVDPPSA
jgi:ABC-type oligopeptide transport system ATPase subunit